MLKAREYFGSTIMLSGDRECKWSGDIERGWVQHKGVIENVKDGQEPSREVGFNIKG